MVVTSEPNPLKTESTITSAATPIVTPIVDSTEIIEMKFSRCLDLKYLLAIKYSNISVKFNCGYWLNS
jgi:hypothetical protein